TALAGAAATRTTRSTAFASASRRAWPGRRSTSACGTASSSSRTTTPAAAPARLFSATRSRSFTTRLPGRPCSCSTPRTWCRGRVEGLLRLVPGIRELHVNLTLFEQMLDDGFAVLAVAHDAGVAIDVWTLDAGTPRWQERLARALDAGVDIVTTNTPRDLARA